MWYVLRKLRNPLHQSLLISACAIAFGGCLGGSGGGGGFDDLIDGSSNGTTELKINQVIPDVETLVIEQGQSQSFFVSAKAPTGRNISYSWVLDSSVALSGEVSSYAITASAGNIGSHELQVNVTDTVATKSKKWTVKVNGPPVVTKVTTGTPKVSVGSAITISVNATDPNNDTLTYTWKINGLASSQLVGSGSSAVLTGADAIVGSINLSVDVSDGTASASTNWTAEVNHFPMACNTLTQGQICTYAGNPRIGEGESPDISNSQIRVGIIDFAVDSVAGVNNYFLADNENNIVWYWNRGASSVTRIGVDIPAGQMKRVAGSGEAATGPEGVPALQSAINNPRGIYYHQSNQTLYVADRNSHLVRYIDSTGVVYNGLGAGTSNADGVSVFTADCNNPTDIEFYGGSIYVSCYAQHRVKRWDLSNDLSYNVLGTGASGYDSGTGTAPTATKHQNPYGLFPTADGLYVSAYSHSRVRFVNWSGSTKTFYSGGASVAINNNRSATVFGSGSGNYENGEKNPTSMNVTNPTDVVEVNGLIFVSALWSNRDAIYVANNTGSATVIAGVTSAANKARRITSTSTASFNGLNLDVTDTRISDPYAVGYDNIKNELVWADYSNRRLRSANMNTWKTNTLVGSGWARNGFIGDTSKPTMEHQFNYPTSVAIDNTTRELFFMDRSNIRIRKVDPYGNIETGLGKGGGDPIIDNEIASNVLARFSSDYDGSRGQPSVAIFSDGNIVYSDRYILRGWNRTTANASIVKAFMEPNRVSTILGDYLNGAGNTIDGGSDTMLADRPEGIALYGSGSNRIVFYADTRNHCVKSIDNAGNVKTIVGNVDGSNNCSDTSGNGSNFSQNPLGLALNYPSGLAVDINGNLIITDAYNHKVRFLNRTASTVAIGSVTINPGEIATIACNTGTTGNSAENTFATAARCNYPTGVAVNSTYICFSNAYHHNVRCITKSDGRVSTVAGSVTASPAAGSPFSLEQEGISGTSARLRYPRGLTFDANGDLFIADTYNHIIRKLKLSSN